MQTRPIWLIAILFVVIVGASAYFLSNKKTVPQTPAVVLKNFDDCREHNFPIIQSYPEQCTSPDGVIYFQDLSEASSTMATSTPVATSTLSYKDQVFLTNLLKNQIISSPLHLEGQANGNWYFEAVFPIKITDSNGNILGRGQAQAQSDWATTSSVAFKADITFVPPAPPKTGSSTGFVILSKDNPSGEVSKADSFKIPVVFK